MLLASPIRSLGLVTTLLALATVAGACGDDSGGGNGSQNEGGNCGLDPAVNTEFCGTTVATNCDLVTSEQSHVCGVPVLPPQAELARTTDTEEFFGTGAPQTACLQAGSYPAKPGTPQNVSVNGFARIFSSGCNSSDLKITFHRVVRNGGADDGKLGEPIGSPVTTVADCTDVGELSDVEDCQGTRWECPYTYPNVPTETEIAIKTESADGDDKWAPLIQYNIYIPNAEVMAGAWEHNVRALATPDYSVIPSTAIGKPITPGNGAVAGEVHDCGDVRLLNATAGIDRPKANLTYFTSDEDKPLPDLEASSTSKLGLYAALDVPQGQVNVGALGLVGGQTVSLGRHTVWVYPDTVTSVTFRGLRPYQVP
jgi:hypothetical protein